jgi:PAS domain-containing protein
MMGTTNLRVHAFYATLLDNSVDAISLVDEHLNVIYRTPSCVTITGWSMADRKDAILFDQVYSADLDKFKDQMNLCFASPSQPIPVTFRALHWSFRAKRSTDSAVKRSTHSAAKRSTYSAAN